MFEILVYLFQNYSHSSAYPEPRQLALKLSAAGFEDDEISEALEWLSGLQESGTAGATTISESGTSTRCYSDEELAKLDVECRGFLTLLESAGVLSATTREMIVERAMALTGRALTLARLKVIVLMVLWTQQQPMDALILEELLSEDDERRVH